MGVVQICTYHVHKMQGVCLEKWGDLFFAFAVWGMIPVCCLKKSDWWCDGTLLDMCMGSTNR